MKRYALVYDVGRVLPVWWIDKHPASTRPTSFPAFALGMEQWTDRKDLRSLMTLERTQEILSYYVFAPRLRGERTTYGWDLVRIEEVPVTPKG